MADPVNTFFGSYFYQLTYDPGTFTYTVGADLGAHAVGDDEGDLILANGTAGDGTEAINEALTFDGPSVPGATAGFYTGQTIGGEPIISSASLYYLVSDVAGLTGTSGTAASTLPYVYPVCFLPGTRIATPAGERAIETLAIGDLLTTASGLPKAVKWVGRMTLPLNRFTRDAAVPVCVKAGALGNGLPVRDLYVSNDHALVMDGLLVHAGALVDGVNFVHCIDHAGDSIEYFHVELEEHDVILAEGAATESLWADEAIRARFDNAAEFQVLYPQHEMTAALDMPRVKFARQVPRVLLRRLATAAA